MGTVFDSFDPGGLFSDANLPGAPMPAAVAAAVPVVQVANKRSVRPPKQPNVVAAGGATVASLEQIGTQAGQTQQVAGAAQMAAFTATQPAAASPLEGPLAVAAHGAPGLAEASSSASSPFSGSDAQGPAFSEAAGKGGSTGDRQRPSAADSRDSIRADRDGGLSSGGTSMLRTLGQSLRGVLPKALRRYVEGELAAVCASVTGHQALPFSAAQSQQRAW
jgi:hypothetical protein